MTILNYETQIFKALISRLKRSGNPGSSFWYPTDHWITDDKELENAIRLDDYMGIK